YWSISPSWWFCAGILVSFASLLIPHLFGLEGVPRRYFGQPSSASPYEVQVFSQDPLILYIRDFLNSEEIAHIVHLAEGNYEVSRVWPDEIGYIDTSIRVSESATVERTDILRKIENRARRIMGWRNNSTGIQPIKVQRYKPNGFYTFHYDWDGTSDEGNRMTTFMVYLVDRCTGGGTNFPRLKPPSDERWCDVIECEEQGDLDWYPGVTFRPIAGSAIFWENFYPNGTPHYNTRHAGLPVVS
ncbi:hypothetical protein N7494_008422, partial [Penicillium frequentans]